MPALTSRSACPPRPFASMKMMMISPMAGNNLSNGGQETTLQPPPQPPPQAPHHATSSKHVLEWTVLDVACWLRVNAFSAYTELFCDRHQIDGRVLVSLSAEDLRAEPLSLTVFGDIKRLCMAIQALREAYYLDEEASSSRDNSDSSAHHGSNGHYQQLQQPKEPQPKQRKHHRHNNNHHHHHHLHTHHSEDHHFKPERWKAIVALAYFFASTWVTAIVMVIVHDRVPDMDTYPPLPDILLDNLPLIPWAFGMCEFCGVALFTIWFAIIVFHKHRFILLRRMFSLFGSVFLLRCVTMLITSLSVPGRHLECKARPYGSWMERIHQAYLIWQGGGMSIKGVRTCGDYMFSGHTVVLTLLNFFITEYTPTKLYLVHTLSWVLNLFGIFFILAAHEHYSIDVFVAFYISTRLFLYYHTLANNRALYQQDRHRTRIWFPLFYFFESSVNGIVPNTFDVPWRAYQRLLVRYLEAKFSAGFAFGVPGISGDGGQPEVSKLPLASSTPWPRKGLQNGFGTTRKSFSASSNEDSSSFSSSASDSSQSEGNAPNGVKVKTQ